jgi:hypothetical protein
MPAVGGGDEAKGNAMRGTATMIFGMVLACCTVLGAAAHAESGAMVEDFSVPRAGLQPMDQLKPGQMIMLGAGERLILTYLDSCNHETIVGGVVSIGRDQSVVVGGKLTRDRSECHGGSALLSQAQATKSAVMVFRSVPKLAAQ